MNGDRNGAIVLRQRAGTHETFMDAMRRRLSSAGSAALAALGTRDPGDPAIALLDAWATLADVLSFYQERIANEGYLRTATERRSLVELARLVGYAPRPGVAASVYLAFEFEPGYAGTVPAGTRVQTVPRPGERPQTFETSRELEGRAEWNQLRVRTTTPQMLTRAGGPFELLFAGTTTQLQPGDVLLVHVTDGDDTIAIVRRVVAVMVDHEAQRTLVRHHPYVAPGPVDSAGITAIVAGYDNPHRTQFAAVRGLIQDASLPDGLPRLVQQIAGLARKAKTPERAIQLERIGADLQELDVLQGGGERPEEGPSIGTLVTEILPVSSGPKARVPEDLEPPAHPLEPKGDPLLQLVAASNPTVASRLYPAFARLASAPPSRGGGSVDAFRVKAALFGHNAPKPPKDADPDAITTDADPAAGIPPPPPPVLNATGIAAPPPARVGHREWRVAGPSSGTIIDLDAVYERIVPGSRVVIDADPSGGKAPTLHTVARTATVSRADYGITARVTRLFVDPPWLAVPPTMESLRAVTVYAQSEDVPLAAAPITEPVGDGEIELDTLASGLEPGRWLVVTGEREDVSVPGIRDGELAMVAEVRQDAPRAGDVLHTTLVLAAPGLAYRYKRGTVRVFANVVHATHGETHRDEVLGNGDGTATLQRFTLAVAPLTYVSAPTPSGARGELVVRVDRVAWPEVDALVELGPADRGYEVQIGEDDRTTVTFGDGVRGARLPTGIENVRATYRVGIGREGNAADGQITQLVDRPLGLKGVVNPLAAGGGADREGGDDIARNAPLAVMALDRLVALRDYADFARTFAGVAKASAVRLSDGERGVVHVTVAAAADAPFDATTDLHKNLQDAFEAHAAPGEAVMLARRALLFLVVRARVQRLPAYEWKDVKTALIAALTATFGFDRRELGEDVHASDVIATMQGVPGVDWVELTLLDAIPEVSFAGRTASESQHVWESVRAKVRNLQHRPTIPVALAHAAGTVVRPAELAVLVPDVAATLTLEEVRP